MKKYILLKSVNAVLPDEEKPVKTNILINKSNGLIEDISINVTGKISANDLEIFEGHHDLLVMPGFIDPHVHFRIPGKPEAEDWFTGSLAALSGGITTVLDMPNNSPAITSEAPLNMKLDHICQNSLINYGIFGGLTTSNLDFLLKNPDIKAIKVYMASTTGDLLMNNIEKLNFTDKSKIFCFHAEDDLIIKNNEAATGKITDPWQHSKIRSEEAALKATREVIEMYKKTGGNFHIAHVSTYAEIKELEHSGVSFECAPHHMFCNTENYKQGGFLWKCNPPLREQKTQKLIMESLYNKKIKMIATDHAPHLLSDKQFIENDPIKSPASGIPSLEVGSHLILNEMANGKISARYASQILSTNAAMRFNIKNRGEIKKGYFADLAIVNQNQTWAFQPQDVLSKCGWTPFVNFSFSAKVVAAFVNGHMFTVKELKENASNLKNKSHQIYKV
ncbi:MAG: amidohydrolase family protein [Spirochaetia bacterium]|nr:amidohydrolase family protein [Spirochaetia bacterium]